MSEGLAGLNLRLTDARFRAPHILSLGFAGDVLGDHSHFTAAMPSTRATPQASRMGSMAGRG